MADFEWPADLVPYVQAFYLQPHTGRSQSPFTRQQKVYGLTAPRWVCRMSLRGGYDGRTGVEAWGARLDALLAKLKGGQHRVSLWDFRRERLRGPNVVWGVGNAAAVQGATSIQLTGFSPYERVRAGDYIGGDGRPHIVTDDADADASGNVTVSFEPPLATAIAEDAVLIGKTAGWFRLLSDDAGANPTEVGQLTTYDLEFVEDI